MDREIEKLIEISLDRDGKRGKRKQNDKKKEVES